MTYFDNGATSYPKPVSVINAVSASMKYFGANSGRGSYELARRTANEIFNTRQAAADFFGTDKPENIIFTQNCTAAINFAVKGLAKEGDHFITSCVEHNAVLRPLEKLCSEKKCEYDKAEISEDDDVTVRNFEKLIKKNTRAIIVTYASNVSGKLLPIKQLSRLAHKHGLPIVVDAAQAAGIKEINCVENEIDFLCVAAHKGLYAPMGIGLLIVNAACPINTLIEGGTGSVSSSLNQPDFLPDRFESGTLSVPLICGVRAGIDFVSDKTVKRIYTHENKLMKYLFSELEKMDNIKLYTDFINNNAGYLPMIPLNVSSLHSEETARLLASDGIYVRAGYHCAYSAHCFYKTEKQGLVRISPNIFTKKKDVNLLLNSLFKIAKAQ